MIASTFKEAQLIEKYGSGIKRIQEGFISYGLPEPTFEGFQGGFRVTVYSKETPISEFGKKFGEKFGEKLTIINVCFKLFLISGTNGNKYRGASAR